MTTPSTTQIVLDAIARVCADALGGADHVFAAGVTTDVTDEAPQVVPLADDFTEAGMPAATVALGPWAPVFLPGQERRTITVFGAIWRPRVELGQNIALLYGDLDRLVDAFAAHTQAYLHEPLVQSAVLMGGPGIVPRAVPRRAGDETTRVYLTLPWRADVKFHRTLTLQPA